MFLYLISAEEDFFQAHHRIGDLIFGQEWHQTNSYFSFKPPALFFHAFEIPHPLASAVMSSVESLMGSLSPEPDHSDGDDDSPVPVPAPVLNPNAPIDFTKISLEIFIQMIVNKMGLGPLFVEELCAFLAVCCKLLLSY